MPALITDKVVEAAAAAMKTAAKDPADYVAMARAALVAAEPLMIGNAVEMTRNQPLFEDTNRLPGWLRPVFRWMLLQTGPKDAHRLVLDMLKMRRLA